ncbi:MAG: hypothetical protein R2847_00330 [Bacteroidia bacterium]
MLIGVLQQLKGRLNISMLNLELTFKVKIYGIIGSDKSIRIAVPIPAYRSNWFLAFIYVAAIALLGIITYLRIKYIRKQEKNKTEVNKKLAEFELKSSAGTNEPAFSFQLPQYN